MLYTPQINKAINIMFNAHKDKLDKGGYPYIFHPYHLAEQMNTEDEIIVALLHDVVEDTELKIEDLIEEGFNSNIIEALKVLTHQEEIDYMDYIRLVKENPLAKKVKIKDLEHNMDITRITNPNEKDFDRINKYQRALDLLNENNE